MLFIPENELEQALVRAVKEPASAPDFYRLLLESQLLVLGTAEGREAASTQRVHQLRASKSMRGSMTV